MYISRYPIQLEKKGAPGAPKAALGGFRVVLGTGPGLKF